MPDCVNPELTDDGVLGGGVLLGKRLSNVSELSDESDPILEMLLNSIQCIQVRSTLLKRIRLKTKKR